MLQVDPIVVIDKAEWVNKNELKVPVQNGQVMDLAMAVQLLVAHGLVVDRLVFIPKNENGQEYTCTLAHHGFEVFPNRITSQPKVYCNGYFSFPIDSIYLVLKRTNHTPAYYDGVGVDHVYVYGVYSPCVLMHSGMIGCGTVFETGLNFGERVQEHMERRKKDEAIAKIQRVWRDAISNPTKLICRRRLLAEFHELG